jgi:2-keto-4-pentenoate hydratase/2-oxohepta-3-ene-1,7-dioic acid hydratase in catechol pathway
MKLVRYLSQGQAHYGSVVGDGVRRITGDPFGEYTIAATNQPLSQVKLLPPVQPTKAVAIALNFRSHLGTRPAPKRVEPFLKGPNCIIAPDEPIVLPKDAGRVDAEGELVAVIGKRCKNVTKREDVWDYILGFTCGNDVSAREWQSGEDKDIQWWRAKSSDTFGPIGPWVVTEFEPHNAQIITRVNGQVAQQESMRDMLFTIPEIVMMVSRYMTLEPGDVIFTGTPGTTQALKPGDVVEVEVPGLGVLRNPVVAET